jgi:hypothetical protein
MEIGIPTWNSTTTSYLFRILKSTFKVEQALYYEPSTPFEIPADATVSHAFVCEFLEKTKKYFTTPLTAEKVLRHLRHTIDTSNKPTEAGWFTLVWKPCAFIVKSGDFTLSWHLVEAKPTEPMIPADFTTTTPRAQSPANPEQASLRQIQIHDSLIPVGDLPLSDLPPLSFGMEESDPEKEESKRRLREARLKVQLAKLKAQRMEQKYYERYGQDSDESGESSEFSSESEEEDKLPFGRVSHS